MKHYVIHCLGCKEEILATEREAVSKTALEHLRTVHSAVMFPSPALDMLKVFECSTFDYPTQHAELQAGIPSEALAPVGEEQKSLTLTVPAEADLTF